MKKRAGITGQVGFIGTHLANYLQLKKDEIELIPFEDEFYDRPDRLADFVSSCDTIFHLAAMNRGDPQAVYECNLRLVRELIAALERTRSKPDVIFASSVQEDLDNPYGRSKREGRELLAGWAARNGTRFTALVIPNVFGPFGLPFYNSAVATFCHQLTRGLEPRIEIDAELGLIYVNDLVDVFYLTMNGEHPGNRVVVPPLARIKVSELLVKLTGYRDLYLAKNVIPDVGAYFDLCLFNTFRSYIEPGHYPVPLELKTDDRGHLAEVVKARNGGQVFFSVTKPGITRGNHFHRRKIERFCVLEGEAEIKLRRIGTPAVVKYQVHGSRPSLVDIPIFFTHNITNVGTGRLYTLFWSSEIYDPGDPDTFPQEV